MVVRCAAEPVAFRVIATTTPLGLYSGMPIHGEVCPGNWIFHRALAGAEWHPRQWRPCPGDRTDIRLGGLKGGGGAA